MTRNKSVFHIRNTRTGIKLIIGEINNQESQIQKYFLSRVQYYFAIKGESRLQPHEEKYLCGGRYKNIILHRYFNCLKQNVIAAIMLRIMVAKYFQVEDIKLYRDISKSNSLLSSCCYREQNAHHFQSSMPSENGQSTISFPISSTFYKNAFGISFKFSHLQL